MNISDFESYLNATENTEISITNLAFGYYPFRDVMTQTEHLAVVYAANAVNNVTGSPHVVVVSYMCLDNEEQLHIWCGDQNYLEETPGKDAERETRVENAIRGLPVTKAAQVAQAMRSLAGKYPRSAKCHFWQNWRRDGSLCKHTETFLAYLKKNNPNFINEMRNSYAAVVNETTESAGANAHSGLAKLAFKVPVLFEGDRGSGKTTTAREFAREHGYTCIELGGHEGLEAPDMLGYLVPFKDGQLVWKDGPLAEAFRKAAKEKVVLIIDELLRIRQRELSLLLTALSPDRDVYRLRTGRIREVVDGVALEEELTCPTENLCVIATTNVGAEYAVDDIDPALAERFVVIRKDTTTTELTRILAQIAHNKGFTAKAATRLVNFFQKMEEARTRGLVKHSPTTRTLARAMNIAETEDALVDALRMQVLLWVSRDASGRPVQEQLDTVERILGRIFAAT